MENLNQLMAAVQIPDQLAYEKFILMNGYTKEPIHESWKANLRGNKFTEGWVQQGNNYAIAYTSDLAVIDADDCARLEALGILDNFADTYTVRSGRTTSEGRHYYIRIDPDSIPESFKGQAVQNSKILLINPDDGKELGDIRFPYSPFYNVGVYSIHEKSRRQYLPINPDADILHYDCSEVLHDLDIVISEKTVPSFAANVIRRQRTANADEWPYEDYGYTCRDFLEPLNSHRETHNGFVEIVGEHPIHGSDTGHNLHVREDGSIWHCFRCDSGGNWFKALAVSKGIIDCADADRDLTADEMRQVRDELHRMRPDVYEKNWIASQRNKIIRAQKRPADKAGKVR